MIFLLGLRTRRRRRRRRKMLLRILCRGRRRILLDMLLSGWKRNGRMMTGVIWARGAGLKRHEVRRSITRAKGREEANEVWKPKKEIKNGESKSKKVNTPCANATK